MVAIPSNLSNHPTYVVLDLGCTRSIGSRAAIRRFQKHALHYGMTTEFCPCNKSFVFANSETETCWESCIIHFPTKPPCSTRVDVLETGDAPILFLLQHMKILGMSLELDPKGGKSTCPTFGLHSSPAEYSIMGHIVLDFASLAYQPKSRARSTHPKRHCDTRLDRSKFCVPSSDDDDKPLVRSDHAADSEDEDDKPLVQPSSRKELVEEKRESATERRTPAHLLKSKEPLVWRDPSATLDQDVSRNSRERSEEVSILGRSSMVKLSAKSSTNYWMTEI